MHFKNYNFLAFTSLIISILFFGAVLAFTNFKDSDSLKENVTSFFIQKEEAVGESDSSFLDGNNEASIEIKKILTPPKPVSFELNTFFFGDVFWGRYVQDWSERSDLKYAYPFSGLNTFEKKDGDVWIANLECPVTENNISSARQEALLKFNCRPEYLPEARKYFDAFSLANNHTDNMDQTVGLKQTRTNLDKHNFQYFGHYDNSAKEDICEIATFEVSADFDEKDFENKPEEIVNEAKEKTYYLPIALCGYHNVFRLPTEAELAVIQEYSPYFITLVMPHQGAEYGLKADSYQQSIYRKIIDYGSDAVLGGHTHTVHNTEVYNNKLIVYSMGNFIFDQQFSRKVTTGAVVNLKFNFESEKNEDFEAWSELARECSPHGDNCLQKAKELDLKKLNFEVDYSMIGSDSSNKLTKKASPELSQQILNQANWSQTEVLLEN